MYMGVPSMYGEYQACMGETGGNKEKREEGGGAERSHFRSLPEDPAPLQLTFILTAILTAIKR